MCIFRGYQHDIIIIFKQILIMAPSKPLFCIKLTDYFNRFAGAHFRVCLLQNIIEKKAKFSCRVQCQAISKYFV